MASENASPFVLDSLLPQEMAVKAEAVGVKKASMDTYRLFALGVLAGAFIGLGAIFATVVATGSSALPFGVAKLLIGLVFCIGLILVVVAGAELFTGNCLITMAWASKKVTTGQLLYNWFIVYIGNFVGSVGTAIILLFAKQYTFAHGGVGLTALKIANGKCGVGFVQAIALGMMCNAMVCAAVWLTLSARTVSGKIAAIIFPITGFVACGFEHCVANMYFIPIGLLVKATAGSEFWTSIGKTAADFGDLTWPNFFVKNLVPVTIGNIIGGAVMVGFVYWDIYLRVRPAAAEQPPETP